MIQALGGVEGILEHTLFKGFVRHNYFLSLFYFFLEPISQHGKVYFGKKPLVSKNQCVGKN
jgi:hypothetical protein